jgi:hypothetical protein
MHERDFQPEIIARIRQAFPEALVTKCGNGIQGFPDLQILIGRPQAEPKWAYLECKKNFGAKEQPNQRYWIKELDRMSFARFIFPENADQILEDLHGYLSA